MYDSKVVIQDFEECIKTICKDLASDDHMQSEIAYIQVKCALELVGDLLSKVGGNYSVAEKNRIISYYNVCYNCLLFYKDIDAIDSVMYKEEYLSEEVCKFIIQRLNHASMVLNKVVNDNNFCLKLIKFNEFAINKLNEFRESLDKVLRDGKIK